MSNSYVALGGALGTVVAAVQLVAVPVSLGARRPEVHTSTAREVPASRHARTARLPPETALIELSALEPPPTGDQLVLWALPKKPRLPVKVRLLPSLGATSLGEARSALEVQFLTRSRAKGHGGCREWLAAVPTGFVCRSQVNLQAGYASVPPVQESATGWQHYRYGVVTAKAVALRSAVGKSLRPTLQKGDGVMVVRERSGQSQLIGHQWLASKDVELATPSLMPPVSFDALPAGARPAWVVPAAFESQVPVYLPGAEATTALGLLPRYSVVLYTDNPARPGRVQVLLTDENRAALRGFSGSPAELTGDPVATALRAALPSLPESETESTGDLIATLRRAAALGAPQAPPTLAVELDATVLRRFVPVPLPPEVGPEERWIDISLQEQVATAYLGKTPLFSALVSTGKDSTTPPGSFFVYRKYLTQTMANQRGAANQYDYREVPHAQFFNGRIGLHAVLWHDALGNPVSHGCVNLSPAAANQFFQLFDPGAAARLAQHHRQRPGDGRRDPRSPRFAPGRRDSARARAWAGSRAGRYPRRSPSLNPRAAGLSRVVRRLPPGALPGYLADHGTGTTGQRH